MLSQLRSFAPKVCQAPFCGRQKQPEPPELDMFAGVESATACAGADCQLDAIEVQLDETT